ncbi:hypothetical protein C0991_006469 [Blastosporella zonata]|nr:hypothetical protein C0991_006469 [Blastosporella zonata]
MSTAHYQGPASLPSDYALLSRFAGAHEEEEAPAATPRPRHLTIAPLTIPIPGPIPTENTPLLNPPVPRIDEPLDHSSMSAKQTTTVIFWEELRILTRYALPVFGTHILEFSLIMASVVSIGHISTTALAAISLGSMTANVTAFSIIQGFASALDTMLPSAWTSSQPQFVGLWTQRMCCHFGVGSYRRYFQSQGLFAVPTQIILVVAPTNALLNYLLGAFLPFSDLTNVHIKHSLGSPFDPPRLHRRTHRHRNLFQSRLVTLARVWDNVRSKEGVAPHWKEELHQFGRPRAFGPSGSGTDGQRVVGVGVGGACGKFVSRVQVCF